MTTCYFGLDCGSLSDWISGIATAGAFAFAVFQLWLQLRKQRQDNSMSQARSVSAWFDYPSNSIMVRNDSNSVIYSIFADIVLTSHGTTEVHANEWQRLLAVLPPHTTETLPISGGWGGMSKTAYARVAFQDQFGRSWLRDNAGNLIKLKKPVYKFFKLNGPYPYYQPKR
jgi:hypothetical protein